MPLFMHIYTKLNTLKFNNLCLYLIKVRLYTYRHKSSCLPQKVAFPTITNTLGYMTTVALAQALVLKEMANTRAVTWGCRSEVINMSWRWWW